MKKIIKTMDLYLFVLYIGLIFMVSESMSLSIENLRHFSNSDRFIRANMISYSQPCPSLCTCHYEIINCNDLIDSCQECAHWRQIDFNQIQQIGPRAFQRFHFAPNQTTSIMIYKLLNGTIGADAFDSFRVPENAQIEITFQYNSMIRLDRHALRGLVLGRNSTVVFNFPYTTQVSRLLYKFNFLNIT